MSHYHAELILPPTDDIRKAVEMMMEPFDENAGPDEDEGLPSRNAFWDFWVIGGRWSGAKIEAAIGAERIKAFRERLVGKKVTCSGLQFGKQSLDPSSQIPEVDRIWSEEFPEYAGACPLFQHYNDQFDKENKILPVDVCAVSAIPEGLKCSTLMIGQAKRPEATEMFLDSIWNGVTWQDTAFDGNVKKALAAHQERIKSYKTEYIPEVRVENDWLAVTVDYHS